MRRPRRDRRGLSKIWLLITLSMISLGFTLPFVAAEPDATSLTWLAIFLALSAFGFVHQARRDRYAFWAGVVAFGGLFAAGSAIPILLDGPAPHPIATAVGGLSAAIALAGAAALWRGRGRSDDWPDILGEEFSADSLFELDGVQMTLLIPTFSVRPGRTLDVEVYAQNTWDAPRTLIFEIAPSGEHSGAGVATPADPQLELGPGEVGRLVLTLSAGLAAAGPQRLRLRPQVLGRGGRRVRHRRRPTFEVELSGGLRVMAFLSGEFLSRGGETLELTVAGTPEPGAPPPPPPRASGEILWSPDS